MIVSVASKLRSQQQSLQLYVSLIKFTRLKSTWIISAAKLYEETVQRRFLLFNYTKRFVGYNLPFYEVDLHGLLILCGWASPIFVN